MTRRSRTWRRGAMTVAFLTVAFGLPWLVHSIWGAAVLAVGLFALGVYGWRMTQRNDR